MELALELGAGSVHRMMQIMPAGEVAEWRSFARRRHLPTRRMELYLAQVAQSMRGGALDQYLLREPEQPAPPEQLAPGVAARAAAESLVAGRGRVRVIRRVK